jgi:hypothetical protein
LVGALLLFETWNWTPAFQHRGVTNMKGRGSFPLFRQRPESSEAKNEIHVHPITAELVIPKIGLILLHPGLSGYKKMHPLSFQIEGDL